MTGNQPEWVTIAHLIRPQGRKGELLAELYTDFPERLPGREVYLQKEKPSAAPSPIQIESHWLPTGRNAGRVVLKLAGIDSISDAEAVAGAELLVPYSARIPLEDGAFYTSDLVGCRLLQNGRLLGTVEDVQFPTTPDGSSRIDDAAPILVIRADDKREALVPFVRAYLKNVDIAARQIAMELPDGLFELGELKDSPNDEIL